MGWLVVIAIGVWILAAIVVALLVCRILAEASKAYPVAGQRPRTTFRKE